MNKLSLRQRATADLAESHGANEHVTKTSLFEGSYSLLTSNDGILDLVIHFRRKDFAFHEIILTVVRTTFDNVICASTTDAFQTNQFFRCSRIDIRKKVFFI